MLASQCSADQNFSREAKRRASTPNDAYRHAANFRPDKFLAFFFLLKSEVFQYLNRVRLH